MRFLTVLSLCVVISACGFHLRGKVPIPEKLSVMAVQSSDRLLQRKLSEALSFSGVTVVPSEADALAVLDLHNVVYDRTVRTLDDRGKVTGYILEYRVDFKVVDASGENLREAKISTRRDFNFDPDLVLQKEIEEESLREDMADDLTRRILRQLSTIAAAPAENRFALRAPLSADLAWIDG